jgi:hypothetical protein
MKLKHVGPFSGWQLTTIICVVFATLFFPATVWAVSGSSVFITDAVTGAHAKVDAARNLQVHQNGTVTVAGNVKATVAGAVTANPPTSSIYTSDFTSDDPCSAASPPQCTTVAKPSAGNALIVTEIHMDVWNAAATGAGDSVFFFISPDGSCTLNVASLIAVDDVNPGGVGLVSLPINSGLVIPAGQALCVDNQAPANISAESYLFGYTVPANAVPASIASPRKASPVSQR